MTDELLASGIAIRERMWGPDAGQKKLDAADDFTREFEEMVTRNCFGEVWGREQLTPEIRSMLTIAMLVALGRPFQLRLHVIGALANGVTREQIREILLHAVPYCGIPAAFDGFNSAAAALADADAK
jgi:4-carboxymuconolactone decarboxylase